MKTVNGPIAEWLIHIKYFARNNDQRLGQMLFNLLPNNVAAVIRGTAFDPFYRVDTEEELYDWIDNHLIFSDFSFNGPTEIIGVFDGDNIIWSSQ